MDHQNRSSIALLFDSTTRTIAQAVASLRDLSVGQLGKLASASKNLDGHIEKAQEFYNNHRDVILISSAVALTFVLTKKLTKKTPEEKPKPKRTNVTIQKTFISDEEDFGEPSMFTGKTAESSEKEEIAKKCKLKILERLESSSEGEDEKIFFEMYKTYQNA